MEIMKILKI